MRAYLIAVLAACGGGGHGHGGGDAGVDGSPDGPPVDAAPDAAPDAPPDASGPTVTAVVTSDGFTQLRERTTAQLVISGHDLDGATGVTVGSLSATIDQASATEIRATVTVEQTVGPAAVTVTAAGWTATLANAIRVTPFVVAPAASGGRGTYESPIGLCSDDVMFAGPGDTVELQDGSYECPTWITLTAGVAVQEAAGASPVVHGFGFTIVFGDDAATTAFRGIGFAQMISPSIDLETGGLAAQHVQLSVDSEPALQLRHQATLAMSQITCTAGGDGLLVSDHGFVELDHVTVTGCTTGLRVGNPTSPILAAATVTHSDFVDNATAIAAHYATLTVQDTTIRDDPATAATCSTGILIDSANATVTAVQITGQVDFGISVTSPSFNHFDDDASLDGHMIDVAGGRFGIAYGGMDNNLWLRDSTLHGQTEAAFVVSSVDSQTDLGTGGQPGNNAFSVVSGFALDDQRSFESGFNRYINAIGTTLNGNDYTGQTLEGISELPPDYRITSFDSGVQF